jgi:hypothetical protein
MPRRRREPCDYAADAFPFYVKGVAHGHIEIESSYKAAHCRKNRAMVAPMLNFESRGVEVKFHGVRQDSPPIMVSIDYELIVDTGANDHRLELLHANVRKFGTISNTVAGATKLEGRILRASGDRL